MSVWDEVRNLIRREVAAAMTLRGRTRIGVVDSYDPANHAVKVRLQPENVLTGWIPVATLRSGSGAGVYFAPNINDQVLVEPTDGDSDGAICTLRLYSVVDPPLNVPAGQMLIQDDAGSLIRFDNAGNLTVAAAAGNLSLAASEGDISITAEGDLTVTVDGDLSADVGGNVSITAPQTSITGDLAVSGIITMGGLEVLTAP